VRRDRAVALAHRVTDTIKQLSARARPKARARAGAPGQGRAATLDRTRLWAMETPQVFARDLIIRAYARVQRFGLRITDDVQAVEGLGLPVTFLENPHPNPKLTTPADLAYMEFLLGCPARPSP
jgi:2-C-methyl-D-erythritol 4-phosphate cytidylyltransferase